MQKIISSICSRDMADIKLVQSDWLVKLWPISQEPDFLIIWDLCRNIANSITFHYRTN